MKYVAPSLRAKRSNPVLATEKNLDCFASLAMTAAVKIRIEFAREYGFKQRAIRFELRRADWSEA
jgi:hypothetical protein